MTDRAGRLLAAATAVVLGASVVLQFVQRTDPVFPMWYFSVDCALLGAIASAWSVANSRSPAMAFLRGMTTTGIVLSGVVYASVIAPASPTGTWFQPWDDAAVRAAIVLMHGIGPVLAIAQFLLLPRPAGRAWSVAARWCTLPLAYLAIVLAVHGALGVTIPYPFLDASRMGGLLPVVGIAAALAAIYWLIGAGLLLVAQLLAGLSRRPGRWERMS